MKWNKDSKGLMTAYTLVFASIFLILIGGLFSFTLFQLKRGRERRVWNQALFTAESGAGRYLWCLNNGVQEDCLLDQNFYDLEGNALGSFSLTVDKKENCSQVLGYDVVSEGSSSESSDVLRTVGASFGKISVAKYAYLLNSNVWAGDDREIRGFYHSNGGIRMDGENQSLVTSAQEDWICTSSFGCAYYNCPNDCEREGYSCRCPGVFTTTNNAQVDLFSYPISYFDFDKITIDLAEIKDIALANPQEQYWPPVSDIDSSGEGYHLKMKSDGAMEIWIIDGLSYDWAYSEEKGGHRDYRSISSEYLYKTVYLPENCPLMFIEDDLWIEGTVKGRPTVASADLSPSPKQTEVTLVSDIEYAGLDGSDAFGLISEGSVLISPDSPDNLSLKGVFVAQKGHFGRHDYPFNIKETLEIYGSIVSNGRVGTQWTTGSSTISGYKERKNYTDPYLTYNPPSFIPKVSSNFKLFDWKELE